MKVVSCHRRTSDLVSLMALRYEWVGKAEIHRINKALEKVYTRCSLPGKFHLHQWCYHLWKNKWDLSIMGGCKKN